MKVLVACEESGAVRDAFVAAGHDAYSCDLKARPHARHIAGDALEVVQGDWDLIIAHPPCTYLANSGVKHLELEPGRIEKMRAGAAFFVELWKRCGNRRKAFENPIMHGHALELVGMKYSQIIQPWQFGHAEQKATCLWLERLPPLQHTSDLWAEMQRRPAKERNRIHYISGKNRQELRSKTFPGIAAAMADQWGGEREPLLL